MAAAQIFLCVFALMQLNVIDANPTVQADNHLLNLMELAKQLNLNTLVKALKESKLDRVINHEGKIHKFIANATILFATQH